MGLEIHAELKTATKMFCTSRNDPDETRPNVNVCPVCMAFPGTLPVANREAIRHVLRVGSAIGGALADYTEFDRKNYFYPDLPKGYQISQYEYPLVSGGMLSGIAVTRVHLEEDTARSQHLSAHGGEGEEWSVIDFNRAGVPLMELVTEPVVHDAKTASAFARELQLLLRYLGAGEANMEKGQMRVEANISVSKDPATLGTKVEVKNLNSFRSVERAIAYEIERQVETLETGSLIVQETRGWDEAGQKTYSQRKKESSHDYRYFPEPDIPKFRLSRVAEFSAESIRAGFPELPWQKRDRYVENGLKIEDAEILVADDAYARVGDEILSSGLDRDGMRDAFNLLISEVRGLTPNEEQLSRLSGASLGEIVVMRREGSISSVAGKVIIKNLLEKGGNPADIAKNKAVLQVSDRDSLLAVVDQIISDNVAVVAEIKAGKEKAMKFLLGEAMKRTKGSGNPTELEKFFRERIGLT
ncbi:MAG: Asp-tRNA(Asn)/Glu-tRNA(Gln) amidotransferase subunit GatB [Patescibacteria group bacterium]